MKFSAIRDVRVDDRVISFFLADGREVSAPIAWSRRLAPATQAQRDDWTILAGGTIVEWPQVDEHIGLWTLLGIPEDDLLAAAGATADRA